MALDLCHAIDILPRLLSNGLPMPVPAPIARAEKSPKVLSPSDQVVTHNVSIQGLTNYNILGYCYQCPQYSLSRLRIEVGVSGCSTTYNKIREELIPWAN